MARDLHPLNMSRYANMSNSCYFAGMWALLHKYNNPLINEIINYKVNGRYGEPLKKFIIDYYNYIHTQTIPIINKQFTDFLTNIRTNLLQQINPDFLDKQFDSSEAISTIFGPFEYNNRLNNNLLKLDENNKYIYNSVNINDINDYINTNKNNSPIGNIYVLNIYSKLNYSNLYSLDGSYINNKQNMVSIIPIYTYKFSESENTQFVDIRYNNDSNYEINDCQILLRNEDSIESYTKNGIIYDNKKIFYKLYDIKMLYYHIDRIKYIEPIQKPLQTEKNFTHFLIDFIIGKLKLYSIVVHSGDNFGGHYTCYFRGNDDKWYYYNDIGSSITPVMIYDIDEDNNFISDNIKENCVFLIYYEDSRITKPTNPTRPANANFNTCELIDPNKPEPSKSTKQKKTKSKSSINITKVASLLSNYKFTPNTIVTITALLLFLYNNYNNLHLIDNKNYIIGVLCLIIYKFIIPNLDIKTQITSFIIILFTIYKKYINISSNNFSLNGGSGYASRMSEGKRSGYASRMPEGKRSNILLELQNYIINKLTKIFNELFKIPNYSLDDLKNIIKQNKDIEISNKLYTNQINTINNFNEIDNFDIHNSKYLLAFNKIKNNIPYNLSSSINNKILSIIKKIEYNKNLINQQYKQLFDYTNVLKNVKSNEICNNNNLTNNIDENTINNCLDEYNKLIKNKQKNVKKIKIIFDYLLLDK